MTDSSPYFTAKPWSLPGDDEHMSPEDVARMMSNRTALQEKTSTVMAERGVGVLQWATGVGKTRAALLTLCKKFRNGDSTATILVPQNIMIRNWEDEIAESLKDSRIIDGKTPDSEIVLQKIEDDEITFKTYQALSIGNVSSEKNPLDTDILVMDEGHHAFGKDSDGIATKANAALKTIKTKSVIVLSATLTNEKDEEEEEIIKTLCDMTTESLPYISPIPLQKAVDDGLLPQPYLLIHELFLEDIPGTFSFTVTRHSKDENEIIVKQKVKDKESAVTLWQDSSLIPSLELTYEGTAQKAYEAISALSASMNVRIKSCDNAEIKKGLQKLNDHIGNERKRLLGKVKTEYVRTLLSNLLEQRKDRVICFTSSVEQAKDLGGEAHCIYSENRTTEENEDIIAAFNKMTAGNDVICSAGMGVEGINFKNITTGILIQLEGAVRRNIQKQGRGLRSINPKTHIIYIRGTKDDEWLGNFLKATEIKAKFTFKHSAKNLAQYKNSSDFVRITEDFRKHLISMGRSHKKAEEEEALERKQIQAAGIFPTKDENLTVISGHVIGSSLKMNDVLQIIRLLVNGRVYKVKLPPCSPVVEDGDDITAIGEKQAFGRNTFEVKCIQTINGIKISK